MRSPLNRGTASSGHRRRRLTKGLHWFRLRKQKDNLNLLPRCRCRTVYRMCSTFSRKKRAQETSLKKTVPKNTMRSGNGKLPPIVMPEILCCILDEMGEAGMWLQNGDTWNCHFTGWNRKGQNCPGKRKVLYLYEAVCRGSFASSRSSQLQGTAMGKGDMRQSLKMWTDMEPVRC